MGEGVLVSFEADGQAGRVKGGRGEEDGPSLEEGREKSLKIEISKADLQRDLSNQFATGV